MGASDPPLNPPRTNDTLRSAVVSLLSKGGHSRMILDGRSRPPLKPPSHVAALRAPPCSAVGGPAVSVSVRLAIRAQVAEVTCDPRPGATAATLWYPGTGKNAH